MSAVDAKNNKKLQEAIVYILKDQPVEIMRLAKLLYLSDYLFAKTFGGKKSFTGLYKRFPYGPVPKDFYTVLDSLFQSNTIRREVNTIILTDSAKEARSLTTEEQACLSKVLRDFKGKSLNQVKNTAYQTEPMVGIMAKENALGAEKGLLWADVEFEGIDTHPLLADDDLDLSFMDTPEFQANLKDA